MELFLEADYTNVKKTAIVRTEIYPIIEKQLDSGKWSAIKKEIGRYITNHHEELYASAPYTRIVFGVEDYNNFWKAIGIPQSKIDTLMRKTFFYSLDFNPRSAKNSFVAAMICVIRWLLKKGNEKDAKLATIYIAFSGQFYPSIHSLFFRYLPNKNVMDYVINNKLSDKYALHRKGTVFGAMEEYCESWIVQYKKVILSPTLDADEYARGLVQTLHDRVKSFLKRISQEYYIANDNKEFLNYSTDNAEEDDFHLTNSNSTKADRWTENTINYMTTHDVNYKFCGMVADQNVKKDEIKNIMSSIYHDPENIEDLKFVVNVLISDFINKYPEEPITGVKFMNYSMQIKPNTTDKNILKLKEIITKWLNTKSTDYCRRKKRAATATSYYKAVLKMIVLTISAANK